MAFNLQCLIHRTLEKGSFMNHIIKQKKDKERSKEQFEPIPLYVPQFEMPAFEPGEEGELSEKKESTTERGVWITEI